MLCWSNHANHNVAVMSVATMLPAIAGTKRSAIVSGAVGVGVDVNEHNGDGRDRDKNGGKSNAQHRDVKPKRAFTVRKPPNVKGKSAVSASVSVASASLAVAYRQSAIPPPPLNTSQRRKIAPPTPLITTAPPPPNISNAMPMTITTAAAPTVLPMIQQQLSPLVSPPPPPPHPQPLPLPLPVQPPPPLSPLRPITPTTSRIVQPQSPSSALPAPTSTISSADADSDVEDRLRVMRLAAAMKKKTAKPPPQQNAAVTTAVAAVTAAATDTAANNTTVSGVSPAVGVQNESAVVVDVVSERVVKGGERRRQQWGWGAPIIQPNQPQSRKTENEEAQNNPNTSPSPSPSPSPSVPSSAAAAAASLTISVGVDELVSEPKPAAPVVEEKQMESGAAPAPVPSVIIDTSTPITTSPVMTSHTQSARNEISRLTPKRVRLMANSTANTSANAAAITAPRAKDRQQNVYQTFITQAIQPPPPPLPPQSHHHAVIQTVNPAYESPIPSASQPPCTPALSLTAITTPDAVRRRHQIALSANTVTLTPRTGNVAECEWSAVYEGADDTDAAAVAPSSDARASLHLMHIHPATPTSTTPRMRSSLSRPHSRGRAGVSDAVLISSADRAVVAGRKRSSSRIASAFPSRPQTALAAPQNVKCVSSDLTVFSVDVDMADTPTMIGDNDAVSSQMIMRVSVFDNDGVSDDEEIASARANRHIENALITTAPKHAHVVSAVEAVSSGAVVTAAASVKQFPPRSVHTVIAESADDADGDSGAAAEYEPTDEAILSYAQCIGLDVVADSDLVWICRAALLHPVPAPWKACAADGAVYFVNWETNECSFTDPSDDFYASLYQTHKAAKWSRTLEAALESSEVRRTGRLDIRGEYRLDDCAADVLADLLLGMSDMCPAPVSAPAIAGWNVGLLLTHLTLSNVALTDGGCESLMSALAASYHAPLTQLDVSGNALGPLGAAAVARFLSSSSFLTAVDVSDNDGVGVVGVEYIARALPLCAQLRRINVSCVGGNDFACQYLADGVSYHQNIVGVDFSRNTVGIGGVAAMGRAVMSAATIREVHLTVHSAADDALRDTFADLNALIERNRERFADGADMRSCVLMSLHDRVGRESVVYRALHDFVGDNNGHFVAVNAVGRARLYSSALAAIQTVMQFVG